MMNATEQSSAIADAESAVRDRPNDSAAFEELGSVYFDAGRFDDAMVAFQRAIALNPVSPSGYNNIGWIYIQIGTPQEAITAFEQAIALDPHFLPTMAWVGSIYRNYMITTWLSRSTSAAWLPTPLTHS
jgi:Flp pilus assembly protein TadD